MITKTTAHKYMYKCTDYNAKYLISLGFEFSSNKDRTFNWKYMEISRGTILGTNYTGSRKIINNILTKPTTRRKHK